MSLIRALVIMLCLGVVQLPSSPARPAITDAAPAVWELDRTHPPAAGATSFAVSVTRLGCNYGVTGTVVPPRIETTASHIIVTFRVTPGAPAAARCPGNRPVPYTVELGEPIGGRQLVDGRCQS